MEVKIIVATDLNGVIGNEGSIPWNLPSDFARLKRLTIGQHVVMGRKTFESIGGPLPRRTNIVLTRGGKPKSEGVYYVSNPWLASVAAQCVDPTKPLWVLGGQDVYDWYLKYQMISEIHWTIVGATVVGDRWFPCRVTELADFDLVEHWSGTANGDEYPHTYTKFKAKQRS